MISFKLKSIFVIALGAALGALLRWTLGLKLNGFLFPTVPFGTLTANLVGSYIIGAVMAYIASARGISPLWQLFIMTGFCGGLTTFSTFSAEVVKLLQQGQLGGAMLAIGVHVGGSLIMTFAGIASWHWFKLIGKI